MLDYVTFEKQTESSLYLRLNDPFMLEASLFARMESDDFALSCMVTDEKKGELMYSTKNLIRLSDFLRGYEFGREEGYSFLISLFEKAIAVNRSKPVLLACDYIYVSALGDEMYFTVLPLQLEYWMFQKEESQMLLEEILHLYQTKASYEIPGYLHQFLKSGEFSLPNLVCGLKNLQHLFCKGRFGRPKKSRPFRASSPVSCPVYDPVLEAEPVPAAQNAKPEPVKAFQECAPIKPGRIYSLPEETGLDICEEAEPLKTQVIDLQEHQYGSLDIDGQNYPLRYEQITIGRHSSCDIQLRDESISSRHAKIVMENGRYYIQDLKSTNKTYLNDKPVIRKMRLREGMEVRFAKVAGVFHEQPV